ncbi:hypothetical protein NL108_015419 [Boleophthalmus pectinirostris]|nr:hypothetical protein NL108_015419 [Boleophthalmus pectinirostris]
MKEHSLGAAQSSEKEREGGQRGWRERGKEERSLGDKETPREVGDEETPGEVRDSLGNEQVGRTPPLTLKTQYKWRMCGSFMVVIKMFYSDDDSLILSLFTIYYLLQSPVLEL